MATIQADSVFERRARLFQFVKNGEVGPSVAQELLPNGEPLLYERALWDYKIQFPSPLLANTSDELLQEHRAEMAELIKDVVAFYNSYGGYLLAGVEDKARKVVGIENRFDCDELNRMLKAATKHAIECHYSELEIATSSGNRKIGLLFIPQRAETLPEPAQFSKDARPSATGKKAYRNDEIYIRDDDQCRPAKSADDYVFLSAPGRRQFSASFEAATFTSLTNNLASRDPGFISLIGRRDYLAELWRWLLDRYRPSKLLAGLGGVGKTTIARAFAEDIINRAPLKLQSVIWLSAKQQFFVALQGKQYAVSQVDFTDTNSFLRALLLELTYSEESLADDLSREELIDMIVAALRLIPSFIIIDDLDSLENDDQHALFHTVLQIMNQTLVGNSVPSRALMTARLDLGAAPGDVIRVQGLPKKDFSDYVKLIAPELGLKKNNMPSEAQMVKFHRVTEGSPTFAASILRLVHLGDNLEFALEHWKGSGGEQVRKFAFEKELSSLSESQIRTLYAACILGDTSRIELEHVTNSNDQLLQDDIGALRAFHLLGLADDSPQGGARLVVPGGIRLMKDLIRNKVADPTRIETSCAHTRAGSKQFKVDIRPIVNRVTALWRESKYAEAVEQAKFIAERNKTSGALFCLLGKAYLKLPTPDYQKADIALKKAHELQCDRPEFLFLRIETKKGLRDWIGVLDVTNASVQANQSADTIYARAEAHLNLGESAVASGDYNLGADNFLTGANELENAFKNNNASGRVADLIDLKSRLFYAYVRIKNLLHTIGDEHVEVWFAVMTAVNAHVKSPSLIKLGVDRLTSWWQAVERRENLDQKSANLLEVQLRRFWSLLSTIKGLSYPDPDLVLHMQATGAWLEERLEVYRRNL